MCLLLLLLLLWCVWCSDDRDTVTMKSTAHRPPGTSVHSRSLGEEFSTGESGLDKLWRQFTQGLLGMLYVST